MVRAEDMNHPHVPIVWKLWEPPIQTCNGTALPMAIFRITNSTYNAKHMYFETK